MMGRLQRKLYEFITIDEAEKFGKSIGCEIHKFKKGRGIIGSIAAIGLPLSDYTFELLAYRASENYGTKRQIDHESVYEMDRQTFPDTFENIDYSEDYIAIEPKTPCPVLYGIRSNNVEALKLAKDIVKVSEPIVDWCIFKTNQHTDMHIQKASKISDMKQFGCYEVTGKVKNKPTIIDGGHMFFYIADESGEIECGAYEPTKNFRKTVSYLRPGDIIKVYGGIGEQNTFNIEKFQVIELNDVEFAGIEKDYKPIPNIPLFVPMLVFSENAPDLTVFGEGKLKAKAGLAAILSDALKKNTVQIGFLLELGNGFNYINGDGLNPKQEKEFFVSWENRSTPLDLSLSYTYANYTSQDTVRNEDVRAKGDSLHTSHYAIPMQAVVGGVGYSIFKSIDTLQVAVGYDWANFNLYEDSFDWTYQKRISALVSFGLYADHAEGSEISGQGNGLNIYYQYTNSDLYRPGTFAESFVISPSGKITPKYRNFIVNELGLNLYGSVQSPLTGARLAAGGKLGGVFNWSTDTRQDSTDHDTLDAYYYNPIFLEGYPYLRSSENYTLAGMRTAVAELHYLFPVYDDWRKGAWIFETRSFYIDLFAQMGAAWNGDKWFDSDKFTDHRFWDRSVGLSFRISNRIFYGTPFDITFTLARGLDRIGEDEDLHGGRKLTPIDLIPRIA